MVGGGQGGTILFAYSLVGKLAASAVTMLN